jgi:glycopeptide antibiotics resistance protein
MPRKTDFVLLLLFWGCLLYFMLLGRNTAAYGYNFIPLYSVVTSTVLLDFIGNICAFIPFSIILLRCAGGKIKYSFLFFITFIVLTELLQFVLKKGNCNIDDVILNSAGFMLGWIVYSRVKIFREKKKTVYAVMCASVILLCVFSLYLFKPGLTVSNTDYASATDETTMDEIKPIAPETWFNDIYLQLIKRIGPLTIEEYKGDMGQTVSCQYVCDSINRKKKSGLVPVAGTASALATCEYLLKQIDRVNEGKTNYGTSVYATAQLIDTAVVNDALKFILNDKFVTVAGNSNKAAYSADGINWMPATLPFSADWVGVVYGNDRFVAVAYNSNKAAYSVDGITWAAASLPSSAGWFSPAYGNGKFVTIGDNKAASSADGITWTEVVLPISGDDWELAFGNGKFLASVSYNSNRILYSSDGLTWKDAALPESRNWGRLAYGNNKFVIVGEVSNAAAYSADGITWKTAALPSSAQWFGLGYGKGKFIATAYGIKAAYSADGKTWTETMLPSSANWSISVAYGSVP